MAETFRVSESEQGARLDKFLHARRPDLSRAFLQALIADGNVRVNAISRKANYAVKPGQSVTLEIPPPVTAAALPEALPLDVLYEDDALLVINKAAGVVVHPAAGHPSGTLVNAILGHAAGSAVGKFDAGLAAAPPSGGSRHVSEIRPGIVHRLDRDTSGVMVVAKTEPARRELERQFAARETHKTYLALVQGVVKTPHGKIDAPLARDPRDRKKIAIVTTRRARPSVTVFHVLAQSDKYTLLRVEPETGRTHQIRVHLAFLKHPVVADDVYGRKKNQLGLTRQFLHAWRLVFTHPLTREAMTFTAPLPADLQGALARANIELAALDV